MIGLVESQGAEIDLGQIDGTKRVSLVDIPRQGRTHFKSYVSKSAFRHSLRQAYLPLQLRSALPQYFRQYVESE